MPNRGMAFVAYPYYVPLPTTEEEIAENGSATIADVRLLIKHADPDPPYPYILRMRWYPQAKTWVMDQAVYFYAGQRKYGFIF